MKEKHTSQAQCDIPPLQRPLPLPQRLLRQPQAALRCPQRRRRAAVERGEILFLRGKGRAGDLQLLAGGRSAPNMDGTKWRKKNKKKPGILVI